MPLITVLKGWKDSWTNLRNYDDNAKESGDARAMHVLYVTYQKYLRLTALHTQLRQGS